MFGIRKKKERNHGINGHSADPQISTRYQAVKSSNHQRTYPGTLPIHQGNSAARVLAK